MTLPTRQDWASNWKALDKLKDLDSASVNELATEVLSGLSLKQKVSQLYGNAGLFDLLRMRNHYGTWALRFSHSKGTDIPPLYFLDGPRGVTMHGSTCFPVSMGRGATFDTELEERVGNAMGIECRSHGGTYSGAVNINLLRHPGWGRAQETYGEDSFHLGEMGAALVRGIQQHTMACVKHYAMNSIENTRFKLNVSTSERTLREVYLPHFYRAIIQENAASVMGAYNKVNGDHCCQNKHLLTDILRDDWGFDGFVTSDWVFGVKDATAAINSGLDIEMPWKKYYKKLSRLVRKNKVSEKNIDRSVLNVLRKKIEFAFVGNESLYSKEAIGSADHRKLALEVAQKSMVLVKNEPLGNEGPMLPLNSDVMESVAIIGRLADHANIGDDGSSIVRPDYVITPLEGLRKQLGDKVDILHCDGSDLNLAVEMAKKADKVILMAGYNAEDEGEYMIIKGGDRASLSLPEADEKLIAAIADANAHTTVVVIAGSAFVAESWREKVPAILVAWYPGMEGGTAIAETLFGTNNPGGKLPVVFPKSESDLPHWDIETEEIEYGYYHGYRLLDKNGVKPAWPFGHGLSYTDFDLCKLNIDTPSISGDDSLELTVELQNTGQTGGDEVVQVYIAPPVSQVDRPCKELKAFRRAHLTAGESRTIRFEVPASSLARFDETTGQWITEPGTYKVEVGRSSDDKAMISADFAIT